MGQQHVCVFLGLASLALAQSMFGESATGGTITCRSTPAEINKPVNVTFTLPENVNQTKRSFTVYHYNQYTFIDQILYCPWRKDKHFCTVAEGYSFNWQIAQNFVLSIPSLSATQTGFYACQVAGYESNDIKPCRVTTVQDTDFKCLRETSTFLCHQEVHYSLQSDVQKHFTLDMTSLSAETATVYSCSSSSSYITNEKSTKRTQGSTCNVHRAFSTSTEALLTCNFHEDISSQKKNVAVYRYTHNTFPDIVVNCTWVTNGLQCTSIKSGYLWNKTSVKDHMTFSVPWAHGGQRTMYACEVQGYVAPYITSCDGDKVKAQTVSFSNENTVEPQSASSGGKRNASCEIPSAHLETETWLVCQFPENISDSRKGVIVSHRSNQGSNGAVALCSWLGDGLQCIAKTGYTWDGSFVTDSVAIRIPRVSKEHAGQYTCNLVKSDDDRVGLCQVASQYEKSTEKTLPALKGSVPPPFNRELNSTDISATCTPSVVTEGQPAAVICRFGDLIKLRSFVILRYNADNTRTPDVPLMCLWRKGQLECEAVRSYEYEIIVDGHTVILRLPDVTSEQLGTYTCQSVTSHVRHGSCTLSFPATPGSEEKETFLERYKVYISGAIGAIFTAAVILMCVIIIYKRGHTKYERPQRRPVDDTDSYRKLDPTVYCKNTGIEENNSLYEEVRESPPSQRPPRPVTVSSARRVPGEDVAHISDVTSRADDKEIPPPLSPRLRPEDSSAPEGEKNPTSPATHPSERPARAVRHSSSSHHERDQDSASPPDPSKYYLHPVQHAVCAVSQENVRQSRDISPASLRDARMHDERIRDQDCRQGARQSGACLQPANVSGNSAQQSPVTAPENLRSVYENSNGSYSSGLSETDD